MTLKELCDAIKKESKNPSELVVPIGKMDYNFIDDIDFLEFSMVVDNHSKEVVIFPRGFHYYGHVLIGKHTVKSFLDSFENWTKKSKEILDYDVNLVFPNKYDNFQPYTGNEIAVKHGPLHFENKPNKMDDIAKNMVFIVYGQGAKQIMK